MISEEYDTKYINGYKVALESFLGANRHILVGTFGGRMQTKERYTTFEDNLLTTLRGKGVGYEEIVKLMPGRKIDGLRSRYYALNQEKKFEFEKARVLVLDIETSLMLFSGWRTGTQYLGALNIREDWFMLSWAAKWLGEDEIFSDVVTSKEAKNKDDKRICKSIWALLDQADVVIGHNSDKFDLKKINTRFIINRLDLPSPSKTVDTLKIARQTFAFSSNSLAYLCKILGIDCKTEHAGWLECLLGDKKELENLVEYNRNDVKITEQLYNVLKVGIKKPIKLKSLKGE